MLIFWKSLIYPMRLLNVAHLVIGMPLDAGSVSLCSPILGHDD